MPDTSVNESNIKFLPAFFLLLAGAFSGFLYTFIFFGLHMQLAITGSLGGIFIVAVYMILEFFVFGKLLRNTNLFRQYIIRFFAYFLLFLAGILGICCLHTAYSQIVNGVEFKDIFMEDYFPLRWLLVFYAVLASLIFQSLWLYNLLSGKEKPAYKQTVKNASTIKSYEQGTKNKEFSDADFVIRNS